MTRTNNFFVRLRSWADDGSGLPIWWQQQYFGTNGVDPYGNPAGDGWNNLQKFQNGWNPNSFYTPAAPANLNVAWNPTNGGTLLTWSSAHGAVTNYLITKTYHGPSGDVTTTFNASPASDSLSDTIAGDTSQDIIDYGPGVDVDYAVTAQYAGGNSETGNATLGYQSPPTVAAARGIKGSLNLVVSGLPADTIGIKVYHVNEHDFLGRELFHANHDYASVVNTAYDPLTNGYFEISSSGITNGIYPVPTNQISSFGEYHFWVQGENANGTNTEWSNDFLSDWRINNGPFLDARQQLKDNLKFLLRAAGQSNSFGFKEGGIIFAWPTNYVFASCYQSASNTPFAFDESRSVVDNYVFRNFALDLNNLTGNGLPSGASYGSSYGGLRTLYLAQPPPIFFDVNTFLAASNSMIPSSLLGASPSQWILPSGTSGNPSSANQKNWYGLPYLSVDIVQKIGSQYFSTAFSPPRSVTNGTIGYYETAQPVFQLTNYYFARVGFDPMPETNSFKLTNTTPSMVWGVGRVPSWGLDNLQVAGYAKLSVSNANSGVYGYLGQYFDKAYKIGTNDVATTNITGILSPYGEFFATEPGQVALVTMPDIDTGARGTCTVSCVSLQLDANHDGVMDLSFNGADATSQARPMEAWLNNRYTLPGSNGSLDQDLPLPMNNPYNANSFKGKITCQRDLENFFRLWFCGVPSLPASQGYSASLRFYQVYPTKGYPIINLYEAETNGGIGYLTDTNVAQSLVNWTALATLSPGSTYTFPTNYFDGSDKHFLFEGVAAGEGELDLLITKNGNPIAVTSAFLDLHDVKDLYEQARVTNVTSGLPPSSLVSQCKIDHVSAAAQDEAKQIVVFVHGANNSDFEAQDSTESIFKRLYWSGYHGRVAEFKWPCAFLPNNYYNPAEYLKAFNFDKGEFYAWKSATAFKDYLSYLTNRLSGYQIDILAHSQGNIVASEAIKQGAPFDNYILTQAAVPAQCYDTSVPFQQKFLDAESSNPTPLYTTNGGYHGYFANLTGNLISFYNTNDFALKTGTTLFGFFDISWEKDQVSQKPENYDYLLAQTYYYHPTNGNSVAYYNFSQYLVTDMQEAKAMVARSRTHALGAQENISGNILSSVDLHGSFGFDRSRDEHSAQFTWPIQTTWKYYDQVLTSYNLQHIAR